MRYRPIRKNYAGGRFGDIDYYERLERYCTYLENINKELKLCSSSLQLKKKSETTFEEWLKVNKYKYKSNEYIKYNKTYYYADLKQKYKEEINNL